MLSASKSGSASGASGYNLTRSLRTRASASGYLSRTYGTSTNNKIFTYSAWIKIGNQTVARTLLGGTPNGAASDYAQIVFNTSNSLQYYEQQGGTPVANYVASGVFQDPSAWYHVMVVVDTTQATAANRFLIYVNGVSRPITTTVAFAQNTVTYTNRTGNIASISAVNVGGYLGFFDGYQTEVNFIDGQALTPSSFGSTNATTGVWQPAKYSGTYGTNGFYLPFTDNSALTTSSNVGLGKDFSGNANYWVTNNISITAGVTYDSMTDVPTLTSATAANFAVLNPLSSSTNLTFSNANLATTYAAGTWNVSRASIGITSGSWYWEVTAGGANNNFIGVANSAAAVTDALGTNSNSAGWNYGGYFYYNGTSTFFATSWTTGDVIGVAFNATTNVITYYKNNVVVNSGGTATAVTGGLYFPANSQSAGTFNVNFGQRPFTYTPPTGFVALNTYNLPTSTIVKGNTVMDATLYSGNLIGQTITNAAAFKPDLVWVKSRSAATDNKLTDSVRGATLALVSNSTAAETTDVTGVVSFNSNGFTLGTSTTYNNTGATYVGWQWQAGQGSTSSNTNGTITSTVSVNASAGFSVVTYTGTGALATVGHGLGVAPSFIIVKNRSSALAWPVYTSYYGKDAVLQLESTSGGIAAANYWGTANPTSSVFGVGTASQLNGSGNSLVAYCWTPIAGFSAFGSYTGNGSTDGTFVYTGFRPKFVMIKRTDSTSDWYIWDTARDTYNVVTNTLLADTSGAETSATSIDDLSNGFKCRSATVVNASGGTYIYATFAENPFKNSLAR